MLKFALNLDFLCNTLYLHVPIVHCVLLRSEHLEPEWLK